MNALPLISVIVPVYKVEAYLDKCISSITQQTYSNLEVILVDDGSPDGSGVICDAWAEKDSRIKVIHKENGGGGAARNTALDMASGELIAFVDSDDYIAPEMFRHLYELLQQGADIAECGYTVAYDDHARFADTDAAAAEYSAEAAMAEHIRDTVFRQLIWNKLYRREVVGDVRFPVGTKIDDEFFTYQLLGNAHKLIRSEKICYAYRQQPDSVMHQTPALRRLEGLRAQQQRLEYLKERFPSLVEEAKFELFFSCMFAMQGCLKALKGDDLQTARNTVREIIRQISPVQPSPNASGKKKLLLKLAQVNFEGICRLLNFMIDIHVLT